MADDKSEDLYADARRSGWRTIRSLVPFLWPKGNPTARLRVVFALLTLGLAKVFSVLTPFVYKHAVDALAPATEISSSFALAIGAVGLTIVYGLTRVTSVGFDQLRDVIFAKVGQRALRMIALETFKHMHDLSLRYHITRKTGGLTRILERGVKGVDFLLRFILLAVGPLTLELLMVAGIFFFVLDFRYFLVVLVTISIYVMFTFRVTEWRVQIRRKMNEQDTLATQKVVDSLLNYETVKYFVAEEREARRYDNTMQGYEKAALSTTYSLAFLNFGQAVIIATGTVSVMVLAAMGVANGSLTVGDFVLVNAFMLQVSIPLNFLGTVYREIRQALIDMGEMFDLLEQPVEVADKPDARPLEITGGEICFENVSFGYDRNRQILKGVSLTVPAGKTVAVVGPSGSGKSTIGKLLFRFYDITSGRLTIDGQDIRDVTQRSLHTSIGVVPQDTVLFNDSIRYNIAYGKERAKDEEVQEVAKAARLHEFIKSLPEGYETQVGERGLKLSGGEKQRVGISRALIKNPRIMLLDEATSALDSETEREILSSFKAMGDGRTVIAIAHRLSTIAHADMIVVLEDGRVVERGTHEALLAMGNRYAAMWHRQQAEDADRSPLTALG